MAEHLDADGHKVHFNANDRFGDLQVDGKYTDVKHLNKPDGVKSAITTIIGQGRHSKWRKWAQAAQVFRDNRFESVQKTINLIQSAQ